MLNRAVARRRPFLFCLLNVVDNSASHPKKIITSEQTPTSIDLLTTRNGLCVGPYDIRQLREAFQESGEDTLQPSVRSAVQSARTVPKAADEMRLGLSDHTVVPQHPNQRCLQSRLRHARVRADHYDASTSGSTVKRGQWLKRTPIIASAASTIESLVSFSVCYAPPSLLEQARPKSHRCDSTVPARPRQHPWTVTLKAACTGVARPCAKHRSFRRQSGALSFRMS